MALNFTFAVMIYNVSRFLQQCIESIINQKGEDVEIILIDDGSTDGSESLCDRYKQIDSRIKVIHQKNCGVAAARNVAIEHAKGKWLIQIDGDDILTNCALEIMREYVADNSDIIQFDSVPFISINDFPDHIVKGNKMVLTGDVLKEYHYQLIDKSKAKIHFPTYNLNPAWSKMWNMNFIRSNKLHYYPDVVKGEGTLFTFTSSYYIKKVTIDPRPIYGYRINQFSIMRRFSADILENQDIQYRTYQKVITAHNENNDPFIKEALYKRGMYLIENALVLGPCHPDCKWDRSERVEWLKKLLALPWVMEVSRYAQSTRIKHKAYGLICKHDIWKLNNYCKYLRINLLVRQFFKRIGF